MIGWPEVSLAEVCGKPQYGAIAKGSPTASGPRFVRQTDVVNGWINWNTVPFCDLDRSDFQKYAIKAGDLLISRLGSVGNAAIVRDTHDAVFAGYLVRFRADRSRVLPEFLGYELQSRGWWAHVNGFRSGAVQPTLNAQQMAAFRFRLPPLDAQQGIVGTLGALDDKIESNNRLVSLIPEVIRALVLRALADASQEAPVADLADFVNGGAYTKDASGTGRIVIRIAELNSGIGPSTVYSDREVPEEKTARAGDILMSWSGSLDVYRWCLDEAIINQHIFKVLPADKYPAWLVFDRLSEVMPVFRAIAKDKATTMGHIQRGHLTSTVVQLPNPDSLARLDSEIAPLWDRMLVAEQESVKLLALRDALLPALLSGQKHAHPGVDEARGAAR